MGAYNIKVTNYGSKEKVSFYKNPVAYGEDCTTFSTYRQKYIDMCELEQQKSDNRRISYYNKKVAELKEIALMNTDLTMAVTLTFKDTVTSYDCALAKWQLFLKRLRHTHLDLKYICVWEYQKQRSEKVGIEKGGVFHFHCLMNIGYVDHNTFEKLWRYGYVWIDYLGNETRRIQAIKYTMKYITKEVIENVSERGKRYIFTSNNLLKPKVMRVFDNLRKEQVIFEHLEDMIKDGEYDLHNDEGKVINHVDYVEYKT